MDTQKLSEISQSQIKKCDQILAASEIVPLSEAQKQLWILCQLGTEGSIKYNKSISLQLRGLLNLAAMERAIQKVVNRHEAMRTTISQKDDSQQIQPSLKVDIPLVDFSNIGLVERDLKVAEWLRKQSQEPFDFTQGPLFRFYILQLEEQLHFLVMTAHHIIIDDWSVSLILQELSALYSSDCQGIDCTLDSPLQFREYIELQTQAFKTEEMVVHESYWLEQFAGSIPVLDIPTDWTRPPIKTYNGSKETVKLDANLCCQIKKVSQEKGCTLFMILFSAYTLLLHRLTDQDEILVGIPTGGRSLKGSENLVGYCSNTLLIRSHIVGEPKFSDYLKTIKKILLDAYEHQDYPFAKLINKLDFNRRSPLVTTTFNLDLPLQAQFFELKTSLFPQPFSFTYYDIHCNVIETEDELVLDCFYNTDLFAPETIKRWLGHFECLLQAIVVNPEQYLTKLPLLTDSQCHQLLVEWNDTKCDYAQDKCIHQLFEDQVEKTPDAVAVMFENQMLTYRQLNQKANQLAHYLQSLGVKPEVLVGICVQPSVDLVVGLLGILKAGGAYVPLDPAYPQERLSYMLADSNVEVLLIQGNLTVNIPPQHAHIVYLDRDRDAIGRESVENLENKTILDDLAYAIYTSGSTGKPKAVLGKIRGIVNRLDWMWEMLPFAADEICVQKTSINFVDHVAEIFSPLLKGIPLVVVPNHIRADIPQLMSLLSEQKITRIVLVPSLLKAMLENTPQQLTQLRYLKYVFCSGEALSLNLAKTFHEKINFARLFNLYGSSEVAADVTCFEVNPWETRQRILQYFKPEVVHGATENSVFGVQQQPFTKPGVSSEILATKFQRSELPLQPVTVDDYYDKFSQEVLPYTINTGSPTFIGHMTSALPDFMHDMSTMISRLNQNLVKIETSKSLIFLEREAIAILHRLLYRFSDEFYEENIQNKSRNLGITTTGGTTANITALLCARNARLLRQENSQDLSTESQLSLSLLLLKVNLICPQIH